MSLDSSVSGIFSESADRLLVGCKAGRMGLRQKPPNIVTHDNGFSLVINTEVEAKGRKAYCCARSSPLQEQQRRFWHARFCTDERSPIYSRLRNMPGRPRKPGKAIALRSPEMKAARSLHFEAGGKR